MLLAAVLGTTRSDPRHSEIIQEPIAAYRQSRVIAKTTGRPQGATPETIGIASHARGRSATPGEG